MAKKPKKVRVVRDFQREQLDEVEIDIELAENKVAAHRWNSKVGRAAADDLARAHGRKAVLVQLKELLDDLKVKGTDGVL